MEHTNSSRSPLEAAAGAAGPRATDAFKLLSNETRLAILLALWEEYDPPAEDNSVPFSTLYERVGVRDSGTFSYHLDKLVCHYIEHTANGYRLRNSGHKIVRAVIAGSGLKDRRLPSTEIPRTCFHCDSKLRISYHDERLYHICPNCEGHLGPHSMERAQSGTLHVYDNFNPAGLTQRTPGEVFVAGTIEYHQAITLLIRGVCPECSGPIEESLRICDTHEAPEGEVCSSCGTWIEARVSYVCSVCKYSGSYPAWVAVYDHPAIVGFDHEHGFDMTFDLDNPEECARVWDELYRDQTLVSTDPVRIRITVKRDGDELHLTLDSNLDVIEITESIAR